MQYTLYSGQFVSRADVLWRVEIWRDGDAPPAQVGELDFDADEAVLIEWGDTSKEEPLCPSTATLRIISPGDRTYEHLYTIKAGSTGVRIFREGALYWCGTLDPEFYEEPYEAREGYTISLTFSDLGVLERIPLSLRGMVDLRTLLTEAMKAARIDALVLNASMMSLQDEGGAPLALESICVDAENWRDEKGVFSDIKKVLADALQPLALRVVSRGGRLYVYDLNGLHSAGAQAKIEWTSDAQTLGVDKVVNDCTLTVSVNAEPTLLDGKTTYTAPVSLEAAKARVFEPMTLPVDPTSEDFKLRQKYAHLTVYAQPLQQRTLTEPVKDFLLFLSPKGQGLAYIDPAARYFCRLALQGGSREEGVAWTVAATRDKDVDPNYGFNLLSNPIQLNTPINNAGTSTKVVLRSHRVYIPPCSSPDYMLRVTLPLLADVRYNPWHDASPINPEEQQRHHFFKVRTGWAFVPVGITLYDEQGNAMAHYSNRAKAESGDIPTAYNLLGEWKSGPAVVGDAWLAYYPKAKAAEDTALGEWASNRPCIGRPDHSSRTAFGYQFNDRHHAFDFVEKLGDGQPIPYPPSGGHLEVVVYEGLRCYDYGEDAKWETTYWWTRENMHSWLRWLMYKAPQVEIARCYGNFAKAELDDVELRAVVNPDAREHLTLDLACGTHPELSPAARGMLRKRMPSPKRNTFPPLVTVSRAGHTGSPEQLLLNCIFSQFAARHVRLAGECAIPQRPVLLFTEACQGERLFVQTGATANLIQDTQDCTFVELTPEVFIPQTTSPNG